MEVGVVALILNLDQLLQQRVTAIVIPLMKEDMHGLVGLGGTDTVDAGNRGHDDHIPPG